MSELVNGFIRVYGAEVHVILYGIKRDCFYELDERAVVHRPPFPFTRRHRTWCTLKTIGYLRHEIKTLRPDTVLSFGNYWNNLVLLSTWGLQTPVYVSDRSSPVKNMGWLQKHLRVWLYPRAAGVIAQTSKAKEICGKLFRQNNYATIGNPIREIPEDTNVFRENIVLSVGRLIRTKHYDRLIRLFHELNRPDWRLVIVGGDAQNQNLMAELQKILVGLGNPSNIELAGTQKDVESYLRRASIFAFTSSSEGFPNAVGEAMSAGLPVISYDCVAGPSEMISDGVNGYLVPVFDDALFQRRLLELMDSPERREQFGRRAREDIRAFGVERIVEKFYQFITQTRSH
ncbi:MAG: glycosyltransferase [Victivallales bacterium]|nr:glycosyltransferase [Victivallales bacterium]